MGRFAPKAPVLFPSGFVRAQDLGSVAPRTASPTLCPPATPRKTLGFWYTCPSFLHKLGEVSGVGPPLLGGEGL